GECLNLPEGCLSGDHGCDVNARCGNIIGSYFCQCLQGYSGDGHSCYDVDECTQDNRLCEHNCMNQPGTYSCVCSPGYTITADLHNCTGTHSHNTPHSLQCDSLHCDLLQCDSLQCDSVQCDSLQCDSLRCVSSNDTCEQTCTNTAGSFLCSCRRGYQLHIDGRSCVVKESIFCSRVDFLSFTALCVHAYVCISLLTDVTSCALRNGGCDHTCSLGAEGHIHCSCRAGWELSADQRTCIVCVAPNTCDCPAGYPGPGCSGNVSYD
uniref:Si:dkey-235d18.5 n=1 Tax=Cyprinus carpio TaxID=7962 RepID=A0A8C2I4F6_CYPCA